MTVMLMFVQDSGDIRIHPDYYWLALRPASTSADAFWRSRRFLFFSSLRALRTFTFSASSSDVNCLASTGLPFLLSIAFAFARSFIAACSFAMVLSSSLLVTNRHDASSRALETRDLCRLLD